MSDDQDVPPRARAEDVYRGESVLDMIARAYDKDGPVLGGGVVTSDFRLDLSPDRLRELEREREIVRSRVFDNL